MVRKIKYGHNKVVTGIQDGSKQVSKDEWNDGHNELGMFGHGVPTTITIVSGAIIPVNSMHIIDGEGASPDDLDNLTTTETIDRDEIWLIKGAQVITVRDNSVSGGNIFLLNGSIKVLDANKPMRLIRSGTNWHEFGADEILNWTADHDADGFDLNDLSNLEFRDTSTGLPANTVHFISTDAGGMILNVPAGDDFELRVDGTIEYTLSSTQADFNSKNIINLGTLNTHTIPGGTGTFELIGHTHVLTSGATDVTITAANLNLLDDAVSNALHFHDSDRARANHTGTQTASTISDFNTQVRTNRLDQMTTPTVDVAWGSVKLTGLADGTNSNDAVNKSQLDASTLGLDSKDSTKVATTANITLSGEQTIDGVLTSADRILVKDQTLGEDNGIYVTAAGAWTRSTDADVSSEVTSGMYCWIEEGTTNGDQGYVLTTNNPITLGTTSLSFTQFSGLGQITAGINLTKTGNTLDFDPAGGVDMLANTINFSIDGHSITPTATTLQIDTGIAGDSIQLQTGGVNRLTITSGDVTIASSTALTMSSGQPIRFGDSNHTILLATNDFEFDLNAGGFFELRNANVVEFRFGDAQADWNGNNLINVGIYESNAAIPATAKEIRFGSNEFLAWRNSNNTFNFSFGLATANEFSFIQDTTQKFSIGNNFISAVGGTAFRLFDGTNDNRMSGGATGITFDILGSGVDYTFGPTDADFLGKNIRNVGFFETNAANDGTGTIRLGNTEIISMSTSTQSDSFDIYMASDNQGTIEMGTTSPILLRYNGIFKYRFDNAFLRFATGVWIEDVANIRQRLAEATVGFIRMTNAGGGLAFRNFAQDSNLILDVDANDEFIFSHSNSTISVNLEANHITPADAQEIGRIKFIDDDSIGNRTEYASIRTLIQDPLTTVETGEMFLTVLRDNVAIDYIRINEADDNQISFGAEVDLLGNNLINVGFFTDNSATPASTGAIRLGQSTNIRWRNQSNTNDVRIYEFSDDLRLEVPNGNDILFQTGGDNRLIISQTQIALANFINFDVTGGDILNVAFLQSDATNPASAGAVRLGNAELIEWRNAGDTNDITLSVNSSDDFLFRIDGTTELIVRSTGISFQGNFLTECGQITMNDGSDFVIDTTTGTKFARTVTGKMGWWNATPVIQPTGAGADLTNSVTVGGTNNTIADFTDLSTYANDAATIRNDIHQLARSLKFLQDSMRLMGLNS